VSASDDPRTAFPASASTPGQQASRTAYQRLKAQLGAYDWAEAYLALRAEGWDWRKAVFIAWASQPAATRLPETQKELATEVLGLKSAHTISKWKRKHPEIEAAIVEQQAAPLLKYRADVFEALGQVARMVDPRAKPDRQLFLEMTGDYKPRQAVEMANEDDEAFEVKIDVSGLPIEVLRALADEEESAGPAAGDSPGVSASEPD
jgi:hypothetical protein